MGNKIKVELAHGGGRAAKFNAEPGACFRCGQQGHWARCVERSHPSIRSLTLVLGNVPQVMQCEFLVVLFSQRRINCFSATFLGLTIGVDPMILL